MNKSIAMTLKKRAQEIAEFYSDKNRSNNFNQEPFEVDDIIPLSEGAAVVIYMKNTGKKALSLFLYMRTMDKWFNIFPTDSHLLAFDRVKVYKEEVERHNYGHNFKETPESGESLSNGTKPVYKFGL